LKASDKNVLQYDRVRHKKGRMPELHHVKLENAPLRSQIVIIPES
jgi:hypothetical protein